MTINCYPQYNNGPAMVLPNGAVILYFPGNGEDYLIDWNGSKEPNFVGEDILHVVGVSRGAPAASAPGSCGSKPGAVRVWQCDTMSDVLTREQVIQLSAQ